MPNFDSTDAFLAHHGVIGMHWGKHLPGKTSKSHNPKRTTPHEDHTTSRELKRNPTRTLSTKELKSINDRLQTEKKYRDLDPKGLSKGNKIVLGIIATAGTATTIYNMANSPAGKAAIKKGKSLVDSLLKK